MMNQAAPNNQPAAPLSSRLPIGRILLTFLFGLIFYCIPLTFTNWILPRDVDKFIHSNVVGTEFYPMDSWFFTYVGFRGQEHAFLGFKFAYLVCLMFNSRLIATVSEVFDKAKK